LKGQLILKKLKDEKISQDLNSKVLSTLKAQLKGKLILPGRIRLLTTLESVQWDDR